MELKLGDLFFNMKLSRKNHRGDRDETMERKKAREKVNVELFIVE